MTALRQRIAAAEKKQNRVSRLEAALKSVEAGELMMLGIRFHPAADVFRLFYSADDNLKDARWRDVCWSRDEDEPDLRQELLEAVLTILRRRLEEATQEFIAV